MVAEFNTTAAGDPDIADYFVDVDLAALQKHFLAALTSRSNRWVVRITRHSLGRAAPAALGAYYWDGNTNCRARCWESHDRRELR